MSGGISHEEEHTADARKALKLGAIRAGGQIPGHVCAGGGAVAVPQLPADIAVAGPEIQHAVGARQISWERALPTGVDVFDDRSAGARAIAFPQLVSFPIARACKEQ